MIKVLKFGGTSMGDASAIIQSLSVARDQKADVVVVSATSGTTDQLLDMLTMAENGNWVGGSKEIQKLKDRHYEIAKELGVFEAAQAELDELIAEADTLLHGASMLKEVSPRTRDDFQSLGERMSSLLLSHLGDDLQLWDARELIASNEDYGKAEPDIVKTKERCLKMMDARGSKTPMVITQGFIASSPSGTTTTLGRGGSDYSAALIAEAVGAKELQIWTDVSGVASTDPRIVSGAVPIKDMSFQEAAEMANAGAKILYPPSMIPARRANIPVYVANTFAPDEGGTWIVESPEDDPLVRAITLKKDQCFVTLTTPKMVQVYGFLADVFAIFARHRISIDQVTTSEASLSVTLDDDQTNHKEMFKELEAMASVEVEKSLAVISLIGNRINHTAGLPKAIFDSLNTEGKQLTVRMVSQGASKHNFCIMVASSEAKDAVKRLHKTFIEEGVSL